MTIEGLIRYFQTHRGSIRRSVSETARRTGSKKSDVEVAKRLFRANGLSENLEPVKIPKILVFDIETSPIKAYVWKVWKENVSTEQIIDDWFVICWSAKWLYSDTVMGDCLTSEEALQKNDKRIVESLWKLFDEADIIIAHNAWSFDAPKMNVRFLKHGMNPPASYRIVDTLQVVKKQFKFTSNKLNALADFFGFDRKLDTDFTLWERCLEGDQDALDYMFKYNKYDVELLEAVYLKLLPWMRNHPNIANYVNSIVPVCCNCGSTQLEVIPERYYKTQIGTYALYRCKRCGAISRGRVNIGDTPLTTGVSR